MGTEFISLRIVKILYRPKKMSDVEAWMENHRQDPSDANKKAREILRAMNKPVADVNQLVKKTIAEVKKNRYTSSHGRRDQPRSLRKEVSDGTL